MAGKAVSVGHYRRKIMNLRDAAVNFPFVVPRLAQILFATIAGIFLSLGTSLIVDVLYGRSDGSQRRLEIGVLCVVGSVLWSLMAWAAQSFLDFLMRMGKDRESTNETVSQFRSWRKRHRAYYVLCMSLLVTVLAIILLLSKDFR